MKRLIVTRSNAIDRRRRPDASENSQISPSTIVRAALVAIHTSRQSCYKAGKSANIHASGIPAKDKITLRNRARVLEAKLGGLAGRLRVPAQVRQGVLSLYSRKEFQ